MKGYYILSTHRPTTICHKSRCSKYGCQGRHPRRQTGHHRPRPGQVDAVRTPRVVRSAQTHHVTSLVESLSIDTGESQLKEYSTDSIWDHLRVHCKIIDATSGQESRDAFNICPEHDHGNMLRQSFQIHFIITETNFQHGHCSKRQFRCQNRLNTILLQRARNYPNY